MKRTNRVKSRDEDPGFVPITWEEALNTIAEKLKEVRERGLTDESGYPRVAASFGGGGTPSKLDTLRTSSGMASCMMDETDETLASTRPWLDGFTPSMLMDATRA